MEDELSIRAEMWAEGMSVKQIARKRYVTAHAMEEYITKHRRFFPYRHKPVRNHEKEIAKRLRDEGKTYVEVGKLLGRHPMTIKSWCKAQ